MTAQKNSFIFAARDKAIVSLYCARPLEPGREAISGYTTLPCVAALAWKGRKRPVDSLDCSHYNNFAGINRA